MHILKPILEKENKENQTRGLQRKQKQKGAQLGPLGPFVN